MSREQLEAAGYGFHHQSEDGKYLIMGNGTDAFAIPAQQESPIKAAEMTTEQNYNMIDGILNNAVAPPPQLPEKPVDKVREIPPKRRSREREER